MKKQRQQLLAASGLSAAQAARKAGIGEKYLKEVLSRGCANYDLAERLAQVFGCRMDLFL